MTPYTWVHADGKVAAGGARASAPLLAVITPHRAWSDVHLVGELDTSTCGLLTELVDERLWTGQLEVRLHLAQLTFCDVEGLRTLVRCQQRLVAEGGRLVLLSPPSLLVRIAGLARWAEELGLVPVAHGSR